MNPALICILVQTLVLLSITLVTLTGKVVRLYNGLALLLGVLVLMRLTGLVLDPPFDLNDGWLRVTAQSQCIWTLVNIICYYLKRAE